MAVGYSDNRFDWCDEILEVKRNYNNDECCNIVKNVIRQQKGADKAFVNDICSRSNSSFKISWRFFPVYSANLTVTYNWDEEETKDKGGYTVTTTTHHTNTNTFNQDFYTSIYDSCQPNTFVGRNDDRFYRLSHVDDLDGALYNDNCVYSCDGFNSVLGSFAYRQRPANNAEYLINRWSVTVLFVPVAVIYYDYNGKTYSSVVNMHNGKSNVNYIISKAVEEKSAKARKASVILKTVSMALSAILFLLFMSKGFWAFIVSGGILGGNLAATIAVKHPLKYFYNQYGAKGVEIGKEVINEEITQIVLTVIGAILTFILF